MRSRSIKLFALFMVLSFIIPFLFLKPVTVNATDTSITNPHVTDKAGLLSTTELSDLEDMCISYGDEEGIGIFILTHDDATAADGEKYIEDYYDSTLYGNATDSVILLVDMFNREVVLEAYGKAETYIPSGRGDVIIDDITPYLSDGDYVTAFETYIKSAAAYMNATAMPNTSGSYTTQDEYGNYVTSSGTSSTPSILMNPFLQLGVALLIGAITVGIMAFNSGGRMTAGGTTYMDQNHSGLIGRSDDYIRTTVTRVRKPQNNNNSGGGFSGGFSAGGHSHSTSRGKF